MRVFFLLLLFFHFAGHCQNEKTVKVHFLYGSKPAKGFKTTETKWFGGIMGGHVTIEADSIVTGFVPLGKNHIFPHKKNGHARFHKENLVNWSRDTAGLKYTSVAIPLTDSQYNWVKNILALYTTDVPYDYAVFGMRCAAAAYDILSSAGLTKKKRRFFIVSSNFYPKPFRRKLLKKAAARGYFIYRHGGRASRKWEKD